MGFAQGPTVIHIKLTDKGRQLLSTGQLTFDKFSLGDSEINYDFNEEIGFDTFEQKILRPKDDNPNIVDFLEQTSGVTMIDLPTIVSNTSIITNTALERGFFETGNTATGYKLYNDAFHVKNPHGSVDISTADGTNQLDVIQSSDYDGSFDEPVVGDYVLVKWANPLITSGTTSRNIDVPVPYIWYKIEELSGTLSANTLTLTVDKQIPNYNGQGSGIESLVYFYPNSNNREVSGDSIQQYFTDDRLPTDFLTEATLAFIENYEMNVDSQLPYVWNMSIIFTEDVAGVKSTDYNYSQYFTKEMGGFVRYIQQISPWIKKIGVIHYTNTSPSNNYGEGFVTDTPVLELPTIMWHKKTDGNIGVTLSAQGSEQTLTGLSTQYYDLADEDGNVVGKVFNDLKIFVIEDQELLFAMSYKGNRSWTLPEFTAALNVSLCPASDIEVEITEVI
jgi:hypothetical protein